MSLRVIDAGLIFPKPLIPLNEDKVKFVILHHPDAKLYEPEQIHADHIKKGWNGAGYNAYVRKSGVIEILRGDYIGAQCANMNSKSYGVCFEGDFDVETMSDIQFNAGVEFIWSLCKDKYKNIVEIGPHSKYCKTGCPGKNFPLVRMIDAIKGTSMLPDLVMAAECLNDTFPQIMNSPDYWEKNAVKGKMIPGELVGTLIMKTAKYVRETSK